MSNKPPNIKRVAAEAGVAVGSVSRVLSGSPRVSAEMRERVNTVIKRLGYVPNLLARGLRGDASRTIGFVIADISNPLFADIIGGAEAEVQQRGYSLLLVNSGYRPDATMNIQILLQRQVEGLLLCLASETHQPTIDLLNDRKTPIVLVDRAMKLNRPMASVVSDHEGGMRAAAIHLIEQGHHLVTAILTDNVLPTRGRRKGLVSVYRKQPEDFICRIVRTEIEYQSARKTVSEILDGSPIPTALIVGANQLLPSVLDELSSRQLRVGKDIALVSFDDVALTRFVSPGITVIQRDNYELGRRSAELLLDLVEGREPISQSIKLPTKLIVRASSTSSLKTSRH